MSRSCARSIGVNDQLDISSAPIHPVRSRSCAAGSAEFTVTARLTQRYNAAAYETVRFGTGCYLINKGYRSAFNRRQDKCPLT